MRRPPLAVMMVPATLMVLAALLSQGCTDRPRATETAEPDPSTESARSYPPPVAAEVPPFDGQRFRTMPPDAAIGARYTVDMWAHCSTVVEFAGSTWRADEPFFADGMVPGVASGTLELLDADTARFVIDDRYYPYRLRDVVIYRRTADAEPVCPAPDFPPYQKAALAPYDGRRLRTYPADGQIGRAYPVDLWAHCPIDLIQIASSVWRATLPYEHWWRPADGIPGLVTGTLERLDDDIARLVIDQQHHPSVVEVVIYVRTDEHLPGCV